MNLNRHCYEARITQPLRGPCSPRLNRTIPALPQCNLEDLPQAEALSRTNQMFLLHYLFCFHLLESILS